MTQAADKNRERKQPTTMQFHTDFMYTSREDRPEYVWRKYGKILEGRILDVGADNCSLRNFLPAGTEYTGIGLSSAVDMEIDLDKEGLPYKENSYDVVLCLDVLEHLNNLHEIFDQMCMVTRKYLIISLPNPWVDFTGMLRTGYYKHSELPMKFYNLPVDPPADRHRWFFGIHEAKRFLEDRGGRNGMRILQSDREDPALTLKRRLYIAMVNLLVHKDVDVDSLWHGTLWAVLEKVD
jgi:hypothetical protein